MGVYAPAVITVLVAGATGAVGSALVPHLRSSGFAVIPHVRPKTAERHPLGKDPRALVTELSDTARLDEHMAHSQAVVCTVGTMRRRFAAGDTYETSDYRPVVQLVESARRAPPPRPRHFVLVSAFGARPGGGYLGWKHKAEEAVRASGLPHTILRPSFIDSRASGSVPSDGIERKPPPAVGPALRLLGKVPRLRGISDDLRPIPLTILCAAIARILHDGAPLGILTGRQIWPLGAMPLTSARR
ncbi:MAG: NAD-dependent epimerase/dehydratase family protein [Deltaproteobacteria bacterium]|nr:MAG: NAD-dependent epimerase/dehydratase family protein [Deltaproteobacteria bacterium]